MAVEQIRGCGYRKVGGLYLVGSGLHVHCDRLPYEIETCPTCGSGVKFTRGLQWLDWRRYAGEHSNERLEHLVSIKAACKCFLGCPVCYPNSEDQPYGLMWVGSEYTPESFTLEASLMGASKRIPSSQVPRKIKLGETLVLLAHNFACGTRKDEEGKEEGIPGIFYAFRPVHIELLIWQSEAKPEYLEDLAKRGITPVIIPDGDVDHDPKTPNVVDDDTRRAAENRFFFNSLRGKIRGRI